MVSQKNLRTGRHQTAFLEARPLDGLHKATILLLHGWPERAISWRHQIPFLADLGYRVIAPDMRGYGDSSTYPAYDAFAIEESVKDMLELLAHLGETSAIWIGHDWGSPVVWNLATHFPQHCLAIANLCVPYHPGGFTLDSLIPAIDRKRYDPIQYPVGQWDYFLYYRENFARATKVFEANVPATFKMLFRAGKPFGPTVPARLAQVRAEGGWFSGQDQAPDVPMDVQVLDDASLEVYVSGIRKNGFFGPNAWYMNDAANRAYAATAQRPGQIDMPVLFLHASHDHTCETLVSDLATPMRQACKNLTEATIHSGHWMAQERPQEVNAALANWLKNLA
jgi:pimeloyl-ACP methyl ester carboxylesterase